MSASEVRALLSRHGLLARRDLGQNFLVDPALARKLVARSGVREGETVLEVGPGLGILTRALAAVAARVVTVEVDAGLVRALRASGLPPNVELRHGDAMREDLEALLRGPGPARVVANLPYAIASPLLRRILDLRVRLEGWSVTLQKEVALRLQAPPGSRDYGSLAVLHHLTVSLEGALDLHPRCFYPVPRVASRFVSLRPLREPRIAPGELPGVERVVRAAFRHRRKTLVNSLRAALPGIGAPEAQRVEDGLAALGQNPRCRAEDLTPTELLELTRRLADAGCVAGSSHG
ncbi:MAG: 16S rRNA (adenine(1518)-N(6)/adenine(1519)-N(6))-dimethyltransferase RsmA [Myxococcota bacterium]